MVRSDQKGKEFDLGLRSCTSYDAPCSVCEVMARSGSGPFKTTSIGCFRRYDTLTHTLNSYPYYLFHTQVFTVRPPVSSGPHLWSKWIETTTSFEVYEWWNGRCWIQDISRNCTWWQLSIVLPSGIFTISFHIISQSKQNMFSNSFIRDIGKDHYYVVFDTSDPSNRTPPIWVTTSRIFLT